MRNFSKILLGLAGGLLIAACEIIGDNTEEIVEAPAIEEIA